jgi:beta-galactosidase
MKRIQLACAGLIAALALTLGVEAQENNFPNPVFPFGAVYFRKSNPPEQDWERDHKTAAQMGVNIFRHWFMWASVENSPGKYDWRDYDRMVELEAQNRIKVVIAEIVNAAPEWMWDKYPHARQINSDGPRAFRPSAAAAQPAARPFVWITTTCWARRGNS